MKDQLLTVSEVATRLRLSPRTVRASRRHLLYREGHRLVARESEINRHIAALDAAVQPVSRQEVFSTVNAMFDAIQPRRRAAGVSVAPFLARTAGARPGSPQDKG